MTEVAASSNRKVMSALGACLAASIIGASAAPQAQAGPLKQLMEHMNQTTKAAKAALGAFDPANATALLQAYAQEAHEGENLRAGDTSAKSKDLRARFARLASTAEKGSAAASNRAQFRKTFIDVVTQCKSCHSVYK